MKDFKNNEGISAREINVNIFSVEIYQQGD
jgi:hypothetical protein